jgi:transcriptional regulator with XRE-family HTH domain
MVSKRGPREVDVHVGNRVRVARQARKMTQEALAHQLGITFQQVQKYEKGSNRISAGRLHQIAGIMSVPITFFFEGVSGLNSKVDPAMSRATRFLATREGTLIADAFPRLGKRTQQAILDLIEAHVAR